MLHKDRLALKSVSNCTCHMTFEFTYTELLRFLNYFLFVNTICTLKTILYEWSTLYSCININEYLKYEEENMFIVYWNII